MMEGKLYYDEEDDKWTLKTNEREIDISNLIYGIAAFGSYFPDYEGEGEYVKFTFEVNQ